MSPLMRDFSEPGRFLPLLKPTRLSVANGMPSTRAAPDVASRKLIFGSTRGSGATSARFRDTLHSMRVLGIDCGGEYTGYGVVEMHSAGKLRCLSCGAIKLSTREPLPRRLSRIYMELGAIINQHQPDEVAIEDVFYALNVKSALKLGQVRGVAMLAAASAGLEVAEYSPLTIKSSVVGYGRAEKQQVQQMVTRLLQLSVPPEPMDASDALAIAICHLHTAGTLNRQRAAVT